jgi:hypothetical protein
LRPIVVVVGVFVLILGCALISVGPFLTSSAFYREEVNLIRQGASGTNQNSTIIALTNDLNQATTVVLLGAILAPIGGAILAYGLITKKGEKVVAEAGETRQNFQFLPRPIGSNLYQGQKHLH